MNPCNGEYADQFAEGYLLGSLPPFEAEMFEEHYFDCEVCLAHLQALQSTQVELVSHPPLHSPKLVHWPSLTLVGLAAMGLLLGFFGARIYMVRRPAVSMTAHNRPAIQRPSTPQGAPPAAALPQPQEETAPFQVADLADLTLPPYTAPSLRSATVEGDFQDGMQAYHDGDCAHALPHLEAVPADSPDGVAAQFYAGACKLSAHNLTGAMTDLRAAVRSGDTPQLEAAHYLLAQALLTRGDSKAAVHALQQTIALHGDYEQRARAQLTRLKNTLTNP